ncbi:Ribose methyltransferase, partial [Linderina macrospora]
MHACTQAFRSNSAGVLGLARRLYSSGKAKRRERHPFVHIPLETGMMMQNNMEFVYGIQPVLAALSQGTRPAYGLYVQDQIEGDMPAPERARAIQLATAYDIPIKHVRRELLDRMSFNNHHQGISLKVDRVENRVGKKLGPFKDGTYWVEIGMMRTQMTARRPYPLWVLVDRIQDPRNLGSIIRSAVFFGAEGIVAPRRDTCAPNAVVAKASAGALEVSNFMRCKDIDKFVEHSRSNGWLVVSASVADPGTGVKATVDDLGEIDRPVLLVLGNEGQGVRESVLIQSDVHLSIPMRAELPEYFDSLNVGVAAGVILSSLRFKGEST